jgi:hypothetical protein
MFAMLLAVSLSHLMKMRLYLALMALANGQHHTSVMVKVQR